MLQRCRASSRSRSAASSRCGAICAKFCATGCQIANPRLFTDEPANGYYDYQDVRDDRILTYFSLGAGAKKTFTAVLNASYGGRFYQPGIGLESMYDPAFHANTTGRWVEIRR